MNEKNITASFVDMNTLPESFPTHRHESGFWEIRGRAVATYGFLEEVLGKAIFCYSAIKPYSAPEINKAFGKWLPKLGRALTGPLGSLVNQSENAGRSRPDVTVDGLERLIVCLRKAARMRNVLCHGSWSPPDETGRSLPLLSTKKGMCSIR